jgi:CRISPR-associated endoribonuclease Cas6
MNNLTFARFQFNFQVETPLHLNFYSGSMLRGAFGHALRDLSCMTKMPDCKSCMLYRSCPYPLVFEHPPQESKFQKFGNIPNPYIIEPPPLGSKDYQIGEVLSFNMVLVGRAMAQLPLIIFAWQRALAWGLGKEKSKARLLNVIVEPNQPEAQVIYDNGAVQDYSPLVSPSLAETEKITLQFVTPLRIQKQDKILTREMTGRDLLSALVRRYFLLQEFHGEQYHAPDFAALIEQAQAVSAEVDFRWCDWQRYSNRQQQAMKLGGVLGSATLRGELSAFLPFLQAGQWLHLGKETTFGMGQYQIL